MKKIAADKILDSTNSFFHWKRLTLMNHPRAVFRIDGNNAMAVIGGTHTCGQWDALARNGVVLHNAERIDA